VSTRSLNIFNTRDFLICQKSDLCQARNVLTGPIITGSVWLPDPGIIISLALKVLRHANLHQYTNTPVFLYAPDGLPTYYPTNSVKKLKPKATIKSKHIKINRETTDEAT